MSIQSADQHSLNKPSSSAQSDEDDGVLIPGSAPPLSPGRTDVNPDDQAGVDELPGNELGVPRNPSTEWETPDVDADKAERDDVPNPR